LRLDETLLQRLDQYALDAGSTRTGLLEEMSEALVEGRMAVLPRELGGVPILPLIPRLGCSPLHPARVNWPGET